MTLDADEFVLRGLTVPQSDENLDPVSRFQERMIFLEQWREMFLDLFGAFTALRTDARKWKNALADVRSWVKDRPSRR